MDKSFDESRHPRDATGKFTEGVGTKAEQEKLKKLGISTKESKESSNLNNEEKRLEEITGEKERTNEEKEKERKQKRHERNKRRAERKRKKQQEKADKLLNTPPFKFNIGNKILKIKFTEDTIGKNLADRFYSDKPSFNWKQRNLDKFPEIIKSLKYDKSSPEKGKSDGIHAKTKEWHYLVGEYTDGDKTFTVVANIADNGKEQILYELSMREKKENKKEPSSKN